MNTKKELSPEMNSALQALALSDIEEGIGHNVTRAQGLQEKLGQRKASLLQDSAEAQALKGKKNYWQKLWKKKWHIRLRYQSCPIYISDRLRKLGLSPMRLRDSPLCLRNSKLSWSKCRRIKGRVMSHQLRGPSHQHPGWVSCSRRHFSTFWAQ